MYIGGVTLHSGTHIRVLCSAEDSIKAKYADEVFVSDREMFL